MCIYIKKFLITACEKGLVKLWELDRFTGKYRFLSSIKYGYPVTSVSICLYDIKNKAYSMILAIGSIDKNIEIYLIDIY